MPKKTVNWAAIKKRYLTGEKPKDIAADYGLTAKQVSEKAYSQNWTGKKQEIAEKVENSVLSDLEEIHALGLNLIKGVMKDIAEARKDGIIGATVQDGEGFPNRYYQQFAQAGLASILEKQKHANKLELAALTNQTPEDEEPPGFSVEG